MKRTAARRLRDGFVAGAIATGAETLWSHTEPRLLGGRPPVFDTTVMASALLLRLTGRPPSPGWARVCGIGMRCAYGPTWAGGWSLLTTSRKGPTIGSVGVAALSIWGFELAILPRSGATPPLRDWQRLEIVLDLTNAAIYAAVAGVILSALTRRSR